jgi:thermostable 8-oxoguanine DNA glycosylase
MNKVDILDLYAVAYKTVIDKGYVWEVNAVDEYDWKKTNIEQFFQQYVWCVLSAGCSNAACQSMYDDFFELNQNPMVIKHNGKRLAIIKAINNHVIWFNEWKRLAEINQQQAIDYLGTLFFIGDITKYHLARNLGIDCAKPDRHLERLAIEYGFAKPRTTKSKIYDKEVNEMCKYISDQRGDNIGIVDVVLWRYCNLVGTKELIA